MTKNKQRIQRMTLAAFFVGIEVLMAFTPIGYIPMAGLSITTMHLPVILAGILGGPAFGAGLGFVFGMTSLIRATMEPSVTSFVFSPFITVGGVSGNFASLLICFVPRILLGVLSGYLYRLFLRLMHKSVPAAALSAVINTVLHTAWRNLYLLWPAVCQCPWHRHAGACCASAWRCLQQHGSGGHPGRCCDSGAGQGTGPQCGTHGTHGKNCLSWQYEEK